MTYSAWHKNSTFQRASIETHLSPSFHIQIIQVGCYIVSWQLPKYYIMYYVLLYIWIGSPVAVDAHEKPIPKKTKGLRQIWGHLVQKLSARRVQMMKTCVNRIRTKICRPGTIGFTSPNTLVPRSYLGISMYVISLFGNWCFRLSIKEVKLVYMYSIIKCLHVQVIPNTKQQFLGKLWKYV